LGDGLELLDCLRDRADTEHRVETAPRLIGRAGLTCRLRQPFNKAAAGDDVALTFQTNYASNTQDHIAADLAAKEIEAEIDARRQASAIIIAEQGRWYTAIIRPLLAFPLIVYFWKVIV
jgi:hypothetical protein